MTRTSLTVCVTVFSITPETYVPDRLTLPEEATHFVDIIEIGRGNVSLEQVILYLPGMYDGDRFLFLNRDWIFSVFEKVFGENAYNMLDIVERAVALDIAS